MKKNLDEIAALLHEARLNAKPIGQLSRNGAELTRKEAYQAQEIQMNLRLKAGERRIGWKMGLTSEGKRKQMNLDSPLYGYLMESMRVENEGEFSMSGRIHPKIEPEIAFLIKNELGGNVSRDEALGAVGAVAGAMEILDSRYEQFQYFSMEDVIADNSSSCEFVVGPWLEDFSHLDLKNLNMRMFKNNEVVQSGVSHSISNDPVLSIVELCRLLESQGRTIEAGSVVLAGAATAAVELVAGDHYFLEVDGLPKTRIGISK